MPSLLSEPPRPAAVRESPHAQWFVVGTVCVGAFMGQLDASIVTIALPRIGLDFHASVGSVEWVALAYLLTLIATVAPVGRLADAVGRKLLYTYGFGVFTAASVICGFAPSLPVLIAARMLQALGAAMLQANSIALITEALPGRLLARGLGVHGSAQAVGLALGPAVGGALLALGGWRLIFLVNLPAGAAGIALGWVLLPRSRVLRQVGRGSPIAAILRRREISIGLVGALASFLVLFGTLLAVPFYLAAHHVGPAAAGLELALLPVAIGIVAPLATASWARRGLLLVGTALLALVLAHSTAVLLVALVFAGAGLGAFTPANNASVMAAAPPGQFAEVGGLLNMARAAGTALGVALAGALYAAGGVTVTMLVLGGVAVVAALALAPRQRGRTKPASISPNSISAVPVVTAGSPAAKARSSSSSSASTTPSPHDPVPSSTGPNTTI